MRAAYTRPAELLRLWREALEQRGVNPLLHYWHLQDQQRMARTPWHQRSPALLGCAAVFLLPLCVFLFFALQEVLSRDPGSLSRLLLAQQFSHIALLIAGYVAMLLLFFVVLARSVEGAQLALGFLETQTPRQLRYKLDELLAVSPLSPAELLLGLCLHILRRLALPLLLLCNCSALLFYYYWDEISISVVLSTLTEPQRPCLPVLPLLVLYTWLSGMLGMLCSLLLLVSLGAGLRASLLPSTGAAAFGTLQWLLFLGSLYFGLTSSFEPILPLTMLGVPIAMLTLCSLLLSLLCLYLARRLHWLRVAFAHCLILPQLALVLPQLAGSIYIGDDSAGNQLVIGAALSSAVSLSIFNPWPLILWLGAQPLMGLLLINLMLVLQLLAAAALAGFAHDALQRRKWGEG